MPDIFINGINICEQSPEDNCLIPDPTSTTTDSNAFQAVGVASSDHTGPPSINDQGDGDPSSTEIIETVAASKIPPLDTHLNTVTQPPFPV